MSAVKIEQVHFTDKEQDTTRPDFVVAKEIALYSQEDANSPYNSLAHKYKGIANEADVSQIFNVVGKDYKLLQHSEMYDMIEKTVLDLGLNAKIKSIQLNEGARLRLLITFPDIIIKIGQEDSVKMMMAFDNSYNATTGLRAAVLGKRIKDHSLLYLGDSFSYFYHRHTKGMDANQIVPTMEKGVEVFQNKVKEKWERYYATKIDPVKAREFLQLWHDEKVISQKYLQKIMERMGRGINIQGIGTVTNQWSLYNVIAEVLNQECSSQDTTEASIKKLDDKVNANLKNLSMA